MSDGRRRPVAVVLAVSVLAATGVVDLVAVGLSLIGLGVLLLSRWLGRGSGAARAVTWGVVGVLTAVLVTFAILGAGIGTGSEATEAVEALYPAWYVRASAFQTGAQILGYLVVAGLLALPASARYFGGADRPGGAAVGPGGETPS